MVGGTIAHHRSTGMGVGKPSNKTSLLTVCQADAPTWPAPGQRSVRTGSAAAGWRIGAAMDGAAWAVV